jgi:hypothetical protein
MRNSRKAIIAVRIWMRMAVSSRPRKLRIFRCCFSQRNSSSIPSGLRSLRLGPIFVPLAASIGLDPVQLGLIMVINLGIGLYTPPIGTTLFISASIAKCSLGDTTRELCRSFLSRCLCRWP